jgi:hypothetical protein
MTKDKMEISKKLKGLKTMLDEILKKDLERETQISLIGQI